MYVNGRNPVLEALRAGESIEKVYVQYGLSGDAIAELKRTARKSGVPVSTLSRDKFKRLEKRSRLKTRSQGVIARVNPVDFVDLSILIPTLWEQGTLPTIAVLNRITDPHNVGAIIRSAECAGFSAVLLEEEKSAPITEVVDKASAGAIHHIPIARSSDLGSDLRAMKNAGMEVVGLARDGEYRFDELRNERGLAVVIGSEGSGLQESIRKACDRLVSIPMHGEIDSLNASVAAGVIFFAVAESKSETRR